MKKLSFCAAAAVTLILLVAANRSSENKFGMTTGSPTVKSINAIAFGPEGILFIGDSKSGLVLAIDTKDKTMNEKAAAIEIKNIDQKIAAALGTEVKNIRIQDLAVNPVSKKLYIAVHGLDGSPVLLFVEGEKTESLKLMHRSGLLPPPN